MSIKKLAVTISIIIVLAIALFIYPSINQSVNAEQSNSTITSLDNTFRITAESNAVLNHYFGEALVKQTLQQPGVTGVRMYYGKNKDGKAGITLVGVDAEKNDILPVTIAGPVAVCPPYCGG